MTLPEKSTLVLCTERGAIPLRKKSYPILQIDEWSDIQQTYAALNNQKFYTGIKGETIPIADDVIAGAKACRTVVVDSLSELANMLVRHIVHDLRAKLVKERTGGKRTAPENVYAELMGMEDWGLYRTKILDLVSAFCHLPKHIIFMSLSAWHKDKTSNDTLRVPNLSGKAAMEVGAFFDCVLHMAADPADAKLRRWRTAGDGMILAKDSSGVLAEFEETDFTKLILKIVGKKKENKNES